MQRETEILRDEPSRAAPTIGGGLSHTPGPWERLEGHAEPGHPAYEAGRYVIRIVRKRAPTETAFTRVALVDSDATWANARLIAAAPDLLERGRDLQAARTRHRLNPTRENADLVAAASDAFDAALSKAGAA